VTTEVTTSPLGCAFAVEKRSSEGDLEVVVRLTGGGRQVLHWGLAQRRPGQWQAPRESLWPAQTRAFGPQAVQTPFPAGEAERAITLRFPQAEAPRFLVFVLFDPDTHRWDNNGGKDYWYALTERPAAGLPLSALQERIVEGEMGPHGWTLMHRFNLCHELIEEADGAREAWATLFVWLRYSAIRQLDWQRNYNTKPRELAHAQDRLTLRLATAFLQQPSQRELVRGMLAGLGRGGDGQRIRDEILHIMHRHHIKEVGGTWMEQWHQKLHNNTTPDDIVICEAYLAFLDANGDPRRYHETLLAGGVTRERLAGFERPINTEPEWHPHLKEGLLHDFGHYLVLLKSVHSGTDLSTAVNSGSALLDGAARDTLGWLLHHFQNPHVGVTELAGKITDVRHGLHARLDHETNPGAVKELLYLDLALEQALRTVIERAIHGGFSGEQMQELIGRVLANLLLVAQAAPPRDASDAAAAPPGELAQCQREWQRLPAGQGSGADWALHAKAALDRLRRAVEAHIDASYQLLQPAAERLGRSFNAEEWVVKLFSEEVVRGQPVFLLSMLIHHFDPMLRQQARLGDWQVISPSSAVGVVEVVEAFRTVQGRRFDRPTIIVAEKVSGDEEPPEGVRAVITPSSVDLVSHVAVRARNASLLFATCFDRNVFDKLKATKGRVVELKVSATGDVLFAESAPQAALPATAKAAPAPVRFEAAKPSLEVLLLQEFTRGRVGGKSWHLKELAAKLPEGVHTPRSVALPFGVFDAVLSDPANQAAAARFQDLLGALEAGAQRGREADAAPTPPALAAIRACVLELQLPRALQDNLQRALKQAGFAQTLSQEAATQAGARIRQVWASKWNERAWFSRQARGFPEHAVQMAVLIQEVVEAEFAFVLHTVNPFSGNRAEVYGEVVLGLGETLVGNYPGRALSFVWPKSGGAPTVLAYPSKSLGLFGAGLICRSDSNAEDLEGYAGAGLYDSVLLEAPRAATLDYTGEPLVWGPEFRAKLLDRIAFLGKSVEDAFSAPQDIEGAVAAGTLYVVQTRQQVGL
jgi:alpha-glucan,water dikinase